MSPLGDLTVASDRAGSKADKGTAVFLKRVGRLTQEPLHSRRNAITSSGESNAQKMEKRLWRY